LELVVKRGCCVLGSGVTERGESPLGFELVRWAVPCGGIDDVDTGSVFNREEISAGLLCEGVCLELFFVAYVLCSICTKLRSFTFC